MGYNNLLLGANILGDGLAPGVLVSLVDGVDAAPGADPHVAIRQHELADTRVQHKPVHTLHLSFCACFARMG